MPSSTLLNRRICLSTNYRRGYYSKHFPSNDRPFLGPWRALTQKGIDSLLTEWAVNHLWILSACFECVFSSKIDISSRNWTSEFSFPVRRILFIVLLWAAIATKWILRSVARHEKCVLPSLFMPICRHFLSRHAWHWFRWALSTTHRPVPAWHLRRKKIQINFRIRIVNVCGYWHILFRHSQSKSGMCCAHPLTLIDASARRNPHSK